MHHLVECERTKALWRACINFTVNVLEQPRPLSIPLAVIFGQWRHHNDPDPLGSEEARAFLRHAFNQFFHDFCNVTHKSTPFNWQHTFYKGLPSLKSAVLRRGQSFKVIYANRRFTALQAEVPQEEREKFPKLITCRPGGSFMLHADFVRAIDQAKGQVQTGRAARSSHAARNPAR